MLFISLTMLLVFLVISSGCGERMYDEDEIAEIIRAGLQDKYSTEFDVLSVTKNRAETMFSRHYYVARCTDDAGVGPFRVGIESDGSLMRDDYEGYLYKKSIDNELLEILTQADN